MNAKISNKSVIRMLMIVTLMEIVLGGGGRLFDFGVISLRMYLFAITLFIGVSALTLARKRIDRNFAYLIVIYTSFLAYFSLVGFLNGAKTQAILSDLKPLLGFYYLLFFYFAIRSKEDVAVVSKVIKTGAILLAVVYLLIFAGINTGLIPFLRFYQRVTPTEEFFFRGHFAFFYKGFIYLGIGAFFFAFERARTPLLIVLAALLITFTRGFVLSLLIAYLFYLLFIKKTAVKLILFGIAIAFMGSAVWKIVNQSERIDRDRSDGDRIIQLREVWDATTPISTITGHGFGVGIHSRPDRMEITYLEIFHKQGVIGLILWFSILFLCWRLFQNRKDDLALPFILAVIFIYVQSVSNPFLMNPIGLGMISVALICLNILRKEGAPSI
jgi:hypothetical protein